MTVKQWYDSIGKKDSIFDVKDPQKFKNATALILCNILHLESAQEKEELEEFCTLLKQDAGMIPGHSDKRVDTTKLRSNIEHAAEIVREQLEEDEVKMMEFMRMLNRFIIVDRCKEEDYCIFDKVRELLFDRK